MTPYEIIGAPFTLWLAPAGTAFPLISVAPAVGWIQIGTNGTRNYSEAGVTVTHNQTIDQARPAGSTGPVKTWRTAEDLMISLTLWDITLEQYIYGLNNATITTTVAGTGTPGFKKAGLSKGQDVATYSALLRGVSPYGDGYNAQYEVPRCYQSGQPKPAYTAGKPAGLDLEFTALEDLTASVAAERFGRLITQHQAAL